MPATSAPARTGPDLVLFLDECVPAEVAERLAPLLAGRPERPTIRLLTQQFPVGTPDRLWLDVVKASGWLVVTADRGMSNRGEKLPRLCRELGVIHIVFSATLHSRLPASEKALAIATCWPDIVQVWAERIGCGHSLRKRDRGPGYKLVNMQTGRTLYNLGPPGG